MTGQTKRISTSAYQALRDALPVVVWYKKSFNRYLRTALRQHPQLLTGIDFDLSKREVADELVDRLMHDEHIYQSVTLQLMMEVANMHKFPELERLEDSVNLVRKAKEAVAELQRHTSQHEQLIIERERSEAERNAHSQQAELARRFSDELDTLKNDFYRLASQGDGNPHQRGRDFEKFLNHLFELFDLEPRLSYVLTNEQIDGAFSFDTDDYVLEAKWTKDKVDVPQANHFATKVRNKGKNALGLLVSVNGFTAGALDEYKRSTPFMTMDHADIICVLEQRARLDDVLRRKKRHANETGECHFPISRLFE
ncbi:restriction endonuclease [Actinokineospora diospyrosa]|uniref:Restriction endonuclease n=1 Tax=Actinokineospora diospyrosa TaxID=103728 RepID=A0ABT1I9U2_9PSEU|nr:restriction endonuclease [Actinokineospora diospyrosa]MCP2269301.1 Restriction endonuclease [Actinokineospora diospyrosa]